MNRAAAIVVLAVSLAVAEEKPPAPVLCRAVEVLLLEGDSAQVTCEVDLPDAETAEVILPPIAVPETVAVIDDGKAITSIGVEKDVMMTLPPADGKSGAAEETSTPKKRNVLRWKAPRRIARKATVTWRARGLGWRPRYRLTIGADGKAKLSLSAAVTNGDLELSGVKVAFHFAAQPPAELDPTARGTRREVAWIAARYWAAEERSAAVLPAYQMEVEGPQEIAPNGVSVIAARAETDVRVETFTCWVTSVASAPANVWRIEEPWKEPMPKGEAEVYRGGVYLGTIELPFTAPGQHAYVSIADAGEIAAAKTLATVESKPLDEAHRDYKWHHVFALSVRNLGKADAQVLVLDPCYKDPLALKLAPAPEKDDGRYQVWRLRLGAGNEATIAQEFYSYHRYDK